MIFALDSKAPTNSEQTNTLSFCPRSCCSNLKRPQSGLNIRMQAYASPVGAGNAGGTGGYGGAEGAGGGEQHHAAGEGGGGLDDTYGADAYVFLLNAS